MRVIGAQLIKLATMNQFIVLKILWLFAQVTNSTSPDEEIVPWKPSGLIYA